MVASRDAPARRRLAGHQATIECRIDEAFEMVPVVITQLLDSNVPYESRMMNNVSGQSFELLDGQLGRAREALA